MSSLHVSDRGWDSYGSRRAMWDIFGLLKVLPFNTQNHMQPCRPSLVTLPIQGDLFGTTGPDDFNQFCRWFQWSQNSALSLQLAVSTGDFHCLKVFKTKHIVPWKKLCPSVAFCCKTRIIPGNSFKGRDIPLLPGSDKTFPCLTHVLQGHLHCSTNYFQKHQGSPITKSETWRSLSSWLFWNVNVHLKIIPPQLPGPAVQPFFLCILLPLNPCSELSEQ